MFSKITNDIRITARPIYLEEHSRPESGHYVWAYVIRIENNSARTMRLTHRHWQITDAKGRTEEVHGEGVVGEQPLLRPGQSFEYSSGCPLATPSGFMTGSYDMISEDGDMISVAIPAFSLDLPNSIMVKH